MPAGTNRVGQAQQLQGRFSQTEARKERGAGGSYPALLGKQPPKGIVHGLVDHLVSKERAPNREQFFNDLLSLMACHAHSSLAPAFPRPLR